MRISFLFFSSQNIQASNPFFSSLWEEAIVCYTSPASSEVLASIKERNYDLNDASRDPSHTCFSSQNGVNISLKASRPAHVMSSTSW
ncbi:hypothetical protein KSP39_PZI009585 [Platanthera zijinensis]|uniref:Uncharacterized protein n=1 Tax=Platanthera zijinensis TaxID=2320716 RepID=A0AAP0G7V9_9ASPA